MSRLRIAYVGLPLGALALARAGLAPQIICLGHPDAPGARRVRRRLGKRALVLGKPDLAAPEIERLLRAAAPDALLSWFWPKKIPAQVLALPRLGAYGVHPSLLPRWRGPDPYFWSILAGDQETGATLHRLDAAYDTGDIIAQRRLPIDPDENAWKLAKRLDRLGLELLLEAATLLSRGKELPGQPQDDADARAAPSPGPEQLAIDWRKDAASIVRLVRAAAPYPGASAELGDASIEVLEAEPFPQPLPKALQPADAVQVAEALVVRAGAGAVRVLKVRTEQGEILRGSALIGLLGAPSRL